jgi:hypothetical protein
LKYTAKTMTINTGNNHAFQSVNGSGAGTDAPLTLTSWKYKFVAGRGW